MQEPEQSAAGAAEPGAPRHPIGVVAERAGVTVHVLRAWEKRHAVVIPQRTASGRRLYSDADVQRLRLLRVLTESGRSIGQVAHLSTAALGRLAREDEVERGVTARLVSAPAGESGTSPRGEGADAPSADPVAAAAAAAVAGALEASERMDAARLNLVLTRAVVSLRPPEFIDGVAVPLLQAVGSSWAAGSLHPAEEHLVSTVLRRVLGWLLDTTEPVAGAPVLLISTPAGERHEFGALLAAAVAVDEGWRVVYPGADLPGREIARAARRVGASLVALSVVCGGEEQLGVELRELRDALGADVPVYVGGAAAARSRREVEAAGSRVQPDLNAWRELLRNLRNGGER